MKTISITLASPQAAVVIEAALRQHAQLLKDGGDLWEAALLLETREAIKAARLRVEYFESFGKST